MLQLERTNIMKRGMPLVLDAEHDSILGTPYPRSVYGTEPALKLYKLFALHRIKEDKLFRDSLKRIGSLAMKQKVLIFCPCPLDSTCHVDILIKLISLVIYGKDPEEEDNWKKHHP